MKTTVILISGMMLATAAGGADPGTAVNLLKNPGFEEALRINTTQNQYFRELLARSVQVEQGDAVVMPAVWMPNPWNGWAMGEAGIFRYVQGVPGKEVHSGTRALFLAGKGRVAVMNGGNLTGGYKVYPEKIPGVASLQLHKPHRFAVCAKGSGKLMVDVYTYDRTGKPGNCKVTPSWFTLTDAWTRHEGTIEFIAPEICTCVFVIAVQEGQATIDDAAFYGEQ